LAVVIFAVTGCGYHVAGSASTLPKGIDTIAIPAFTSGVNQYRLADQLAAAISHEFATRTKYHVVPSASDADAVLHGSIGGVNLFPTVSDPATGRAASVGVVVTLSITLTQRSTGRVLYSRPNFQTKDYYEIATDPHQTFDESGPAFRRLSEEVARDVVASVVDNF
jgi:hypothetical protein